MRIRDTPAIPVEGRPRADSAAGVDAEHMCG